MVTRSALIYLSQHEGLKEFAAHFQLFKKLTTRFVAGETIAEAVAVIRQINGDGCTASCNPSIDYRNRAVKKNASQGQWFSPGLIYNQWLGTALQAMGVQPSEYETAQYAPGRPAGAGTAGYGFFKWAGASWEMGQPGDYTSAVPVLGEIPPFLKGTP